MRAANSPKSCHIYVLLWPRNRRYLHTWSPGGRSLPHDVAVEGVQDALVRQPRQQLLGARAECFSKGPGTNYKVSIPNHNYDSERGNLKDKTPPQIPNHYGIWSQKPYWIWSSRPNSSMMKYLDPLGHTVKHFGPLGLGRESFSLHGPSKDLNGL